MTSTQASPPTRSASRRWKRLTPVLLFVVGFGAGALATHHLFPRLLHLAHEGRMSGRSDSDRRGGRRANDRGRPVGREARDSQRTRRFRDQLARRLELDEAQQRQMDAFIETNRAEASAFWDDTYARYRELRLRFRGQIREILNESQQATFDAWMRERERNDRGRDSVGGSPAEASPEGVQR